MLDLMYFPSGFVAACHGKSLNCNVQYVWVGRSHVFDVAGRMPPN